MLGRTYEGQVCSAARALEVLGERWTLLIIRDALFADVTRFREFQRRLGLASNTLKDRLDRLITEGIIESRSYSKSGELQEYVLTDMGRSLGPVLVALTSWGDEWLAPEGPPVIYTHGDCGGDIVQVTQCEKCRDAHEATEIVTRPGPGARRPEMADRP